MDTTYVIQRAHMRGTPLEFWVKCMDPDTGKMRQKMSNLFKQRKKELLERSAPVESLYLLKHTYAVALQFTKNKSASLAEMTAE